MSDEKLFQMHFEQHRSHMAQGFVGIGQEWRDHGTNLVPAPKAAGLSYQVLAGADDNIQSVRDGIADWSAHLGVAPTRINGAGHLIFLTHTEHVITEVTRGETL